VRGSRGHTWATTSSHRKWSGSSPVDSSFEIADLNHTHRDIDTNIQTDWQTDVQTDTDAYADA